MAAAPGQKLVLRQGQSLVMTPQLQQAIKLLQLSNLELAAYLETELERNPLLERDEGVDRAPGGVSQPGGEMQDRTAEPLAGDRVGVDRLAGQDTLPSAASEPLDADFGNVWTGGSAADPDAPGAPAFSKARGEGRGRADDAPSFEETVAGDVTLREHLLGEVGSLFANPVDRAIAFHLVDWVDDAGYFGGDTAEIAQRFKCSVERIEAVLARCRSAEPTGVFARTLGECLALQLADKDRLDPAMRAMLDHLDMLARRDIAGLKRVCGVGEEDIAEMAAEIRALDPKPGLVYSTSSAPSLVPDVVVRRGPNGRWIVELEQEALPRLIVDRRYRAAVSPGLKSKADRDFVQECAASASWLVKALHQRATTILKVATEIVRRQNAFFERGVAHLKPMTLRDVAEAIGVHESTVSRVVANKAMATPCGTFEMKWFFTAALHAADGGESHSAQSVKARIRALIDHEPKDAVLSDDRLVEILRGEGVDIARRTVAKYREAMRIPSSIQRRRQKGLGL